MTHGKKVKISILTGVRKDFSDDPVVKNLPTNAWEGHGFDPWSGKIPHAVEQLTLCAMTTEAHTPRGCALQQEKPL